MPVHTALQPLAATYLLIYVAARAVSYVADVVCSGKAAGVGPGYQYYLDHRLGYMVEMELIMYFVRHARVCFLSVCRSDHMQPPSVSPRRGLVFEGRGIHKMIKTLATVAILYNVSSAHHPPSILVSYASSSASSFPASHLVSNPTDIQSTALYAHPRPLHRAQDGGRWQRPGNLRLTA